MHKILCLKTLLYLKYFNLDDLLDDTHDETENVNLILEK